MRAVIQRSLGASAAVEGSIVGEIKRGLVVLLGVSVSDGERDAEYMAAKISAMRIFEDAQGKLNLSLKDIGGEMLVISNFTLCGDGKKGNRPSFIEAARPEQAVRLYEHFIEHVRREGVAVSQGVFGGDMKVSLINDGPVTIILDSAK